MREFCRTAGHSGWPQTQKPRKKGKSKTKKFKKSVFYSIFDLSNFWFHILINFFYYLWLYSNIDTIMNLTYLLVVLSISTRTILVISTPEDPTLTFEALYK